MMRNGASEAQSPINRVTPQGVPQTASLRPDKGNQVLALVFLVGALMYLISPLDLIPDVIPVLCHLDDVGVMGMACNYFKKSFC